MKITLILPRGPLYRFKRGIFRKSLQYAPLTLSTLASLIPRDMAAEIEIIDEGVEAIPACVNADLVGISAITGSANRAYQLADALREQGTTVVMGGVHPTLMPTEAAEHADSVVVGFAEESFPRLLRDFQADRLERFYYQRDDLTLEDLPLPRRDLMKMDRYILSNSVQATRGCTNSCDFCVVPIAWGNRMYFRPVKDVAREIEQMDGRDVIFVDVNPIENREYARDLFRELIPLKKRWASPLTIQIAEDDELLDLAVKSGCRAVLIGFESINDESIADMGKGFNLVKNYRERIRKLHDRGIAIMGCFVFGCDSDDTSVFDRTIDFVGETGVDLPRYTVHTPFPGTPLFKRLQEEHRIIEDNWDYYDAQHVVFRPLKMTPQELQDGLQQVWNQTYRFRSILKRLRPFNSPFFRVLLANIGYRFYAGKLPGFSIPAANNSGREETEGPGT